MGRPAVLKVDIIADASGTKRGVNDAESVFGRLGKAAGKVGKIAAVGLAGIGVAALSMGGDVVRSASDAEQALGAVESVFGKYAKSVQDKSKAADKALGLSAASYNNLAAVVGSQLQSMGKSQKDSAKQTDELIALGADLAATFGGDVSDAVGAVGSLLRGERDPIERYGVSIKAADVNARLAALGLDKLTGKARTQAEATATLQLLTEKTKNSHGAFAREADTTAGAQARLTAQLENQKAAIGEKLLPIMAKLMEFASKTLIPIGAKVANFLATKLGPAFATVGKFITEKIMPPARAFFTWIATKIAPVLRDTLVPIIQKVIGHFTAIGERLTKTGGFFDKLFKILKPLIEFIVTKVAPVVGEVLKTALDIGAAAFGFFLDIIESIIDAVRGAIEWIQNLVDKISNSAVGKAFSTIGGWLSGSGSPDLGMRPNIAIGAPGVNGIDGRTTGFSAGMPSLASFAVTAAGRAMVIVDRREIVAPVTITGVLDTVGGAQLLDRVSREHAVRMGTATSYLRPA